jgi:23S rRNA (uracil1939-C5)-methyltransferase
MVRTPPVIAGQIINIRIDGITYQGWGTGRFDGFTVFIPGTLPGEKVKAKIKEVKKNFAMAQAIDVEEQPEKRAAPCCSVYDSCGGCQLQHVNYRSQLELKATLVSDALSRIGKLKNVKIHPVIGMKEPWGYRNRAQFHVKKIDGKVCLGFFQPGTQRLTPVEKCRLLPDIFNDIVRFLEKQLSQWADVSDLLHVVIKKNRIQDEVAVIFVTRRAQVSELKNTALALAKFFPKIVSVIQNVNPGRTSVVFGPKWRTVFGSGRIQDRIGKVILSMSPGSFVQVNPEQTEALYTKVLDYAGLTGREEVIDVYCGTGSISLWLAPKAKKVYGIEEFKEAVEDAKLNAQLNNVSNAEFFAGKSELLLPGMLQKGIKADVIVLDPPRRGCAPEALNAIAEMKPERIVYVSCNPATLARDLGILAEKGFEIVEVQPVDMFPQTVHVEVVALMSRVDE